MSWGPDLQDKIPNAEKPEAGRHEEARLTVLPAQDGALPDQYLNWTRNQPTPECWWCRYPTQTREHLFKVCPE